MATETLDLVLRWAAINTLVVAVLAAVVFCVTRLVRWPAIAHLLWLLLLARLFVPPLVELEIALWRSPPPNVVATAPAPLETSEPAPRPAADAEPTPMEIPAESFVLDGSALNEGPTPPPTWQADAPPAAVPVESSLDPLYLSPSEVAESLWLADAAPVSEPPLDESPPDASPRELEIAPLDVAPPRESTTFAEPSPPPVAAESSPAPLARRLDGRLALLGLWLAGSLVVFARLVAPAWRLRRAIRLAGPLSADLIALLDDVRRVADLKRPPRAVCADGAISPLVVASLGRPILVLPQALLARMTPDQRRLVIAHEIAHIRRGDHLVRYLEAAASVVYWWHPAVWLARGELRIAEERCCDELVLAWYPDQARRYGEALLDTVDFLAGQTPPLPAAASGFVSERILKQRLEAIMDPSQRRGTPRLVKYLLLALAAIALPLSARAVQQTAPAPASANSSPATTDAAGVSPTPAAPAESPDDATNSAPQSTTYPSIDFRPDAAYQPTPTSAGDDLSSRIARLEALVERLVGSQTRSEYLSGMNIQIKPDAEAPAFSRNYDLGNLDFEATVEILQTILADRRDVRVFGVPSQQGGGLIVALGSRADHQFVAKIMQQLRDLQSRGGAEQRTAPSDFSVEILGSGRIQSQFPPYLLQEPNDTAQANRRLRVTIIADPFDVSDLLRAAPTTGAMMVQSQVVENHIKEYLGRDNGLQMVLSDEFELIERDSVWRFRTADGHEANSVNLSLGAATIRLRVPSNPPGGLGFALSLYTPLVGTGGRQLSTNRLILFGAGESAVAGSAIVALPGFESPADRSSFVVISLIEGALATPTAAGQTYGTSPAPATGQTSDRPPASPALAELVVAVDAEGRLNVNFENQALSLSELEVRLAEIRGDLNGPPIVIRAARQTPLSALAPLVEALEKSNRPFVIRSQ
jgi:beta-lactamase regulating signal transducer with metallopeptidase domain/biopolymer transport protein ExbD